MSAGEQISKPTSPRAWAHHYRNTPNGTLMDLLKKLEKCQHETDNRTTHKLLRRKATGIKLLLQERGVTYDSNLAPLPEQERHAEKLAEEREMELKQTRNLVRSTKYNPTRKSMTTEISKERRILNGIQLGTYYTIACKNYHGTVTRLRVPIDVKCEVDDIILFAAAIKGEMTGNSEVEQHIFDYSQVTAVDKVPNPGAEKWIIQVVDIEAWQNRVDAEHQALEEIRVLEQQRESQAVMANYGDSLPEELRGTFDALSGRFSGPAALAGPGNSDTQANAEETVATHPGGTEPDNDKAVDD